MRCEDCLPLIEEYFDGEVTGQTAASVSAHLAACADCAAALDALSFEQEVYARYDRGGLEVTPDLWARVSAEIARTPNVPESPVTDRPFLKRARDYFAAALGTLAVRPALASSLALLVVAATAGTLWLSRRAQTNGPTREVAFQNTPARPAAGSPTNAGTGVEGANPKSEQASSSHEGVVIPAAHGAREVELAQSVSATRNGGTQIKVDELLDGSSAPKAAPGIVVIGADDHAEVDPTEFKPALNDGSAVVAEARLLDPEQKDLARHVERAQMLLRSIKNVRASDVSEADIAYEKSLSRKLLAENATLQLEAEVKGDKETKQVLDRIEPFLLDIANMEEKPSREEVRSIRERVRQNEIVAVLEVY